MWTKQLDRVLLVPGPGGAGLARTEDPVGVMEIMGQTEGWG